MQQGNAGMRPCRQTKGEKRRGIPRLFSFNRQLGCRKILGVQGGKAPLKVNFFEEKRGEAFFT